jgi:hypothetical protein
LTGKASIDRRFMSKRRQQNARPDHASRFD